REAARRRLPFRRTHRDAESETRARGGLRDRRVSLRRKESRRQAGHRLAAARPVRRQRSFASHRILFRPESPRTRGAGAEARGAGRTARLHRPGAGRTEPLEHEAFVRVAAVETETRGGSELRPFHRRTFPSRHELAAVASGQKACAMPDEPGGEDRPRRDGALVELALCANSGPQGRHYRPRVKTTPRRAIRFRRGRRKFSKSFKTRDTVIAKRAA